MMGEWDDMSIHDDKRIQSFESMRAQMMNRRGYKQQINHMSLRRGGEFKRYFVLRNFHNFKRNYFECRF